MNTYRNKFQTKSDFTLYNRLNNEQITGSLINEDEIEGKKFYVMQVGQRTLKLAKDAYSPKKMFLTR